MGGALKKIGRGLKGGTLGGLKGAWKGIKFGAKHATRPEVLGALQIAGMFIPGVNIPVALRFLMWAQRAKSMFPQAGSGGQRLEWVLEQAQGFGRELAAEGVDVDDFLKYLEYGVKLSKGDAKLVDDQGHEIAEEEFDRLAALMEG